MPPCCFKRIQEEAAREEGLKVSLEGIEAKEKVAKRRVLNLVHLVVVGRAVRDGVFHEAARLGLRAPIAPSLVVQLGDEPIERGSRSTQKPDSVASSREAAYEFTQCFASPVRYWVAR